MAGMEAEAMRLLPKRFMWRAWISGVAIGVIIAPFTVWPLFPDMPGWVFTSLLLVAVVQCLGLGLYLSHVTEQRKR
jgi:hypothetical protein